MRENWKSKRSRTDFHRIKGLQRRFKFAYERSLAGGYAMLCVILRLVWHDGWSKTAPWLLTTMSPGCFLWCSLLIPWKSKDTKTQSEVSNEYQIRWCKLLDNYLHQDLLENEPEIVLTTKKCTAVEDPVTETNSKAAVRGLFFTILHLSDTLLRPGTAWNWTSTDRLDNEGMFLCRRPSYGDKFQGGGERVDFYPPISLTHIWIQESSETRPEVVPSTAQYFMAVGKEALKVLQSAAAFIPVPLIREAVGVALKIMEVCEERCEVVRFRPGNFAKWLTLYYCQNTSVVGRKVGELKDRVYHLSNFGKSFDYNLEGYSRNFYTQQWKRQWRGQRRVLSGISRTYERGCCYRRPTAPGGPWTHHCIECS